MNFENLVWNKKTYKELLSYLDSIKDESYKEFNSKIISTKYEIKGIRLPILRNIAKQISKTDFKTLFPLINEENYEIVLIEGLLLSYLKDYKEFTFYLKSYVNKIDNWGICDSVANSYKIFLNNDGIEFITLLIKDDYEYSKRLGYVLLLNFYMKKEYLNIIFSLILKNDSEDYYVLMAISWLLCECFVNFKDETYEFLLNNKLNKFILKKTISKVNDSYRVSKSDKLKLKSIRVNSKSKYN